MDLVWSVWELLLPYGCESWKRVLGCLGGGGRRLVVPEPKEGPGGETVCGACSVRGWGGGLRWACFLALSCGRLCWVGWHVVLALQIFAGSVAQAYATCLSLHAPRGLRFQESDWLGWSRSLAWGSAGGRAAGSSWGGAGAQRLGPLQQARCPGAGGAQVARAPPPVSVGNAAGEVGLPDPPPHAARVLASVQWEGREWAWEGCVCACAALQAHPLAQPRGRAQATALP